MNVFGSENKYLIKAHNCALVNNKNISSQFLKKNPPTVINHNTTLLLIKNNE